MRGNKHLMDLSNSEFAMTLTGMRAYAKAASSDGGAQDVKDSREVSSILTIVDDNGRMMNGRDAIANPPRGSVAIIDMIGPVMKYGGWWAYGADEIVAALKYADNHPNIVGTAFNIDGPGGGVNAIDPFMKFAASKKKPVVSIADQAASLHYWTMCAVSDYKMAGNSISSEFGSVGVVCSFYDDRKYIESLGFVLHEIYPGESIHKNESFRLALEGKYDQIISEELSPIAQKFQGAVKAACPNLKADVLGVLTGKMFRADVALQHGMIDAIGSMDDAINRVHMLSELNHYKN